MPQVNEFSWYFYSFFVITLFFLSFLMNFYVFYFCMNNKTFNNFIYFNYFF